MKRLQTERERAAHVRYHGVARLTWRQAVVDWGQHAGTSLRPKTAQRYLCSLRAVLPVLRDLYLDEIDRKTIAKIAGRKGVSNATRRRDLTAVSAVLAHAVRQGSLEVNQAREWDRSGIKEARDPIVLPDKGDIDSVVAEAPGLFASLIRTAQFTGMRQEEVADLVHTQIDLKRRAIQLVKTKTNKARSVPLDERAWGTIAGTPQYVSSPYVFWHGEGDRYLNVSSRFAVLAARAERRARKESKSFNRFRFHDLRHWFAVDYLRRGGGIYDLQQILGHNSIKTTEMYLDYLTPDEKAAAQAAPGAIQ